MPLDNEYNFIDEAAWSKAGWNWTAFLVTPDLDSQPGIGLMFKDYAAGVAIFDAWRKRFGGAADRQELLRVGIVTGTHPTKGDGYSITLTTDMHSLPVGNSPDHYVAAGIRWRFHDTRGENQSLGWFKASVEKHRKFFVVPMPLKPDSDAGKYFPHMIGKTKIHLSSYSSIAPDSQDAVVLTP